MIEGDDGKRYDRFRDRVMFPIHDSRGHVIGFGGRVLGEGEPKYLNSPETPLFEKGRELYGLFQARDAIRDAGRVLVVEGYMDVVALAQHGVELRGGDARHRDHAGARAEAAAPDRQRRVLLRRRRRRAQGGLARAREHAAGAGRRQERRFLFLPDGEDPDTYVRAARQGGVRAALVARRDAAVRIPARRAVARSIRRRPPRAAPRCVAAAKPLRRSRSPRRCSPRCCASGSPSSPGLPEAELRGLLAAARDGRRRRAARAARDARHAAVAAPPVAPARRRWRAN